MTDPVPAPVPVPVPIPETNTFKALVRTIMPLIYSSVAAIIAHFGYHVSNSTVIQIVTVGFGGLTIILHLAETKWAWVGALLGYIGAPVYVSTKASQAAQISQQAAQIAELEALVQTLMANQQQPPASSSAA